MPLLKVFLSSLILVLSSINCTAQKFCQQLHNHVQQATLNTLDPRADTFDVLSYHIDAAFLNYKIDKRIDAVCTIEVVQLKDADVINLDLLGLNVSQVLVNGNLAIHDYSDPLLSVTLGSSQAGDTLSIAISYDGNPKTDAQWGGFYFTGDYAFNLGVGFAADPHGFGRVWFPCFDNFTDRAIYYTEITVDSGIMAYANGYLADKIDGPDQTTTYRWTMDEPIPTYLASVAIAPYAEVSYVSNGIPVVLTSLPGDTVNMKSSFENLPACIQAFLTSYGSHSFDRIGFNMVPFNAGAMEHATNIAYPLYAISGGGKQSETLFAHELAHHWWGNTTTCASQEEMWLNEGWASYSEALFTEAIYGIEAYNQYVQDNHRSVLQFSHIRDGAVLPVSGIGHANTYGSHVYDKGADMVHTLRGMMGDEDFFSACADFQQQFKFQSVTTDDMKTVFQGHTSVNLTVFFDQWIKEAGFAHFYLYDWFKDGNEYRVTLRQHSRFNSNNYLNQWVPITAIDANGEMYDTSLVLADAESYFLISPPFEVEAIVVDYHNQLSDATTCDNFWFEGDTSVEMGHSLMDLDVVTKNGTENTFIRLEHHWASPDHDFLTIPNLAMSKQRYWVVDGLIDSETAVSANFTYSGLTSNSPSIGYLDNELIRITEDSLVLLYRPDAHSNWELYADYTKNMGSAFNKFGDITIHNLKKGQYTLGMYDAALLSVNPKPEKSVAFSVYPNPAKDVVTLEFDQKFDCCTLEITDMRGVVVKSQEIKVRKLKQEIDVSDLQPGNYLIGIISKKNGYTPKRLVVE